LVANGADGRTILLHGFNEASGKGGDLRNSLEIESEVHDSPFVLL
jgi:hypothetical protein